MFNRIKYFITKNFKKSSIKERLIKNKVKYTLTPKQYPFKIIIRKYHSSNTNINNNENNPQSDYNMFIICSNVIGKYLSIKKL